MGIDGLGTVLRSYDGGIGVASEAHFDEEERTWQMGNKTKKGASVLIKLVSMAGTGFFYVKKKNPRTMPEKLQLRKYDPRVKQHVLFSEQKMR